MKVLKKITVCLCAFFLILAAGGACFYVFCTAGYDFNIEKLKKSGACVTFFDNDGNEILPASLNFCGDEAKQSGSPKKSQSENKGESQSENAKTSGLKSIDELPAYLPNAFIAVEDKRFYKHGGIDLRALARAAKNNLLNKSFKEGGSTITQQLIKNTHLSGEKTLKRKLRELKLTLKAEKELSKKQILYYYLTTIYFGENCYGIENAALNYFGKHAKNLSLNESAALAATVKSPAYYNPRKQANAARKDLVLKLMKQQNLITEKQFSACFETNAQTCEKNGEKSEYFENALEEFYEKTGISPYERSDLKIYTYFNAEVYKKLKNCLADYPENAAASVMTANGEIIAEIGDTSVKRSPASTIKPLLVYAPALETKTVTIATKINDERTNFSGYYPKNYGDVYYGDICAKDALKKSLNVTAVKILNAAGLKKSAGYAEKAGIKITDLSLASALGAIGDGAGLTDLCGSYTVFACGGEYRAPTYVKKATSKIKTIFSRKDDKKSGGVRVFSRGTAALINECLHECTLDGTARAIGERPYTVCAKTGTNGTPEGNDDAYTIAYTANHVIGIRFSGKQGEKLPDCVTGGYVAEYSSRFLNDLYKNEYPAEFQKTDEVVTARICAVSYADGKLLLADKISPERYVLSFNFLKGTEPTEFSAEFSHPKLVESGITVENDCVKITAERKNFVYAEIIRSDENGNKKIADLKAGDSYRDEKPKNGTYSYTVIPYYIDDDGEKHYGDEQFLGTAVIYDKIAEKEWWSD